MKRMRVGLSVVLVGTLILTLVLTACKAGQAAPDPDEIVLYETTKVFTEEEAENVLEFTEDRDTIVFEEVTAFVADIEPGDVLVCNQSVPGGEYGFLERVIEVSDDGTTVEVEPATLEDVIEQGVIVVNQTIPVEDLMADAMWATGVQVLQIAAGYDFSYSPITGVTIKGRLTATADAQVDLQASFWRGLQKFELVFSPGLEMEGSLEAAAGVSWEKEWTLGEVKTVIPIYPPVALNLGMELVVGTTGRIEVKLETSVTYDRGYDLGFRYTKDAGWSTINKIKGGGADLKEPTLQGEVEGVVYGGVRLSATVGVSYVLEAGLELALLGNVKGSGVVAAPPPWKCEYDFELYLTAQLAANLDVLLIGDAKYEWDPWRWPDPPEYNLAYGASGRVETESGQALPGVTMTFSDGRAPDTTDSAGYWCKHLSTGAVTVTPQLDGYTFSPPNITMDRRGSNYDFVATKKVQYVLTTSSTDFGDVIKPSPEGPHPYDENAEVTLGVKEDANGEFTHWTSDNSKIDQLKDRSPKIKMDGNYTVTAHFKELKHYCGDGHIDEKNDKGDREECDPGGLPQHCPPDENNPCDPDEEFCDPESCNCTPLRPETGGGLFEKCGDGTRQSWEQCDPGNAAENISPDLPPGCRECTTRCTCESNEYIGDIAVGGSVKCSCNFDVYSTPYLPENYDCDCGWISYTSQSECGCSFPDPIPTYKCNDCTVTIYFWAEDISGGSYPITSVELLGSPHPCDPREVLWPSSPIPPMHEEYFQHTYVTNGRWCGSEVSPTSEYVVRAENEVGTVVETLVYIVCPPQSS